MPLFRSTDPGTNIGADILAGYDGNVAALETATQEIVNLGPGLLGVNDGNGGGAVVEVPYAPDGLYSAPFFASLVGLTVNYSAGVAGIQKNSTHLVWPPGSANLTPNIEDTDRVDLLYCDTSGPAILVAEGIAGLTPSVVALGLPLLLVVVPAGEDGSKGTAFVVELRRFTPETQTAPQAFGPNLALHAMPIAGETTKYVWCPGGKSEIVDAETFDLQWQHGGGTLYVKPGGYYDGTVAYRLPEASVAGAGWKVDLVDVSAATGDPASPVVELTTRSGIPRVNGEAVYEVPSGWGKAAIHCDGTDFYVVY